MILKIKYRKTANGEVPEYYRDNKKITQLEYRRLTKPRKSIKLNSSSMVRGKWPLHSDALGCHPSQVADMEREAIKRGVPTKHDNQGRAVFTDRGHRKAYLKAFQFQDNDGGYGD